MRSSVAYFESSRKCFHEKLRLTAENDLVKIVRFTSAADDDVGEGSRIEKPGCYQSNAIR
jgi:hypothetical protein